MEKSSLYFNSSYSEPYIRRKKVRINCDKVSTPYLQRQSLIPTISKKEGHLLDSVKEKRKTSILTRSLLRTSTNPRVQTISLPFTEKSRYFHSKLIRLLSEKSTTSSSFSIYSQVFSELAEYLLEFKEILMVLKKGLVLSGIQEREFSEFEFKSCLGETHKDLSALIEKERREKAFLVTKLNKLSDEIIEVKAKYEDLMKKYLGYEKIIKSDPNKFIEAEKLLEKMMRQCEIINSQQKYIGELQFKESKMKKIIEICEEKGLMLEETMQQSRNSVINPKITQIYKRSSLVSMSSKSCVNSSDELSD